MTTLSITRAGLEDLDAAWAIVNEYQEAVKVKVREDRDALAAAYFSEDAGLWLARVEGAVVGCIALRPLPAMPGAGEVKRLYVQPEWRGQGIATELLDDLEDYAEERYEWLYLDSKDDLEAALIFYFKSGYNACPRYNQNPQATVFMRKQRAERASIPESA